MVPVLALNIDTEIFQYKTHSTIIFVQRHDKGSTAFIGAQSNVGRHREGLLAHLQNQ
jgi:hypothetical protein